MEMGSVDIPNDVAAAFQAMPEEARAVLLGTRARVFHLAEAAEVGALTETLKWGEPAYLTEASKAGSTIRLGVSNGRPAVFFNCQTTLVEGFRTSCADAFEYVGNRALVLSEASDPAALDMCLTRALTYHRDKTR